MKNILLLPLFVFLFINSNSQNLLSAYALPGGTTTPQQRIRNAFHIDASNNKWIGFNLLGLGKFDGSVWTMYDSINSSLPSNHVYAITHISSTLWVGTLAGISSFNGVSFSNFALPMPLAVTSLTMSGNNVFAGTMQGLYKFDGTSWQSFTTNNGLVNDTIQCLASNSNGEIWIGTKNGLSFFANNSFTNFTSSNSAIVNNSVSSITITKADDVWIATQNSGAYKIVNGDFVSLSSLLFPFPVSCTTDALSLASYNSIGTDDSSNVYILKSNLNTLIKIKDYEAYEYVLQDTSANGFYALRSHILSDANGKLWFSRFYIVPPPPNANNIYSIDISSLNGNNIMDNADMGQNNLNINQVSARILNLGDMHWDPILQNNHYEVPVCSKKQSVYTSALWLGGLDAGNNLHTAAMTYRQQGAVDFFAGPLDTLTGLADSANLATYDRLWKVDRNMIHEFQQNFTNPNYQIPEPILTWPAQGTGNYSRKLAPFVDYNNDGIYNPFDGDYPQITGDQMLWWVFNDTLASHTETGGAAFGFEIHGKAYAYTCPSINVTDEAINYTTFYQYKIINRSSNIYHDMYIGLWTDYDLGNAADDYVGCDTMLDAGFVYNADNDDEGSFGYGVNPPMQNNTILKGPLADANDGIDNNHNGIIDEANETIGISHFVFYKGVGAVPDGYPSSPEGFNQYLNGIWLDGLPITYGGDGRDQSQPPVNFMFPGTPYDTGWTMPNANIPGNDMRYVMSSGKFTIAPGEERTIDFAYVFTWDSTAPNGLTTSIAKNTADLIKVRQWFDNNNFPSCFNVGVEEIKAEEQLKVYPNPANNILQLKNIDANKKLRYAISDVTGRVCLHGIYNGAIDISKLKTQLYLIRMDDGLKISYAKFVKL